MADGNGGTYRFTPNAKGYLVHKEGNGKPYQVYVAEGGVPTFCDCPSFKFQPGPAAERTPCKHMMSVFALVGSKQVRA